MQENNQIEEIMLKMEEELEKVVEFLRGEYAVIRAGRANPHILDKITVDYYGVPTPLNQMANMSVQEARLLVVSLFDQTQMRAVTKALSEADLGVNISDDGRVIRLTFPELTEERRRDIVKQVKQLLENAKVGVRNARREALDAFKALKNEKLISEDDMTYYEKEVQKIVDDYTSKLDQVYALKEKEVMQV